MEENKNSNNESTSEPAQGSKKLLLNEEEVTRLSPEKLSEILLDKPLVKKRGFLIALEGNGDTAKKLASEINVINLHYTQLKDDYKRSQQEILDTLYFLEGNRKTSHAELKQKEKDYDDRIKTKLPLERAEIKTEVEQLQTKIFSILKAVGQRKENIVEDALDRLKKEMDKAGKINRDLQDDQNNGIEKEYLQDKEADAKKITFWNEILRNYKEKFDKVMFRLQYLAKDGINNQTASFLIFLGTISAIVSGWWFSLWTGPISTKGTSNIGENTSVKIFFLDNISRFLSHLSLWKIATGLTIYLLAVSLISWLCYSIQIRYGFITRSKRKKKDQPKKNPDTTEEIEVNLQEEDEILKLKMRTSNWWSLWLKMAPVIFAVMPLLAIVSGEAASGGPDDPNFNNLFSSLVNQFIGTCIAISFSTFTILYFSRVVENKYHDQENKSHKGGGMYYFGFLIFTLFIVCMLLYHYPIGFFADVRRIAILGFFVSCIAAGFSLGYGNLFRNLHENSEFLLQRIDIISNIIYRYSRPFRVNYTSNRWLRSRLYLLQQKIMDLIQNRQELAIAIAGGYDSTHKTKEIVQPQNNTIDERQDENSNQKKKKKFWEMILAILTYKKRVDNQERDEKRYDIIHNISAVEMKFYSEKAEELNELNAKIKELRNKIDKLEEEEFNYWRNGGTHRSIKDQIINHEKRIKRISFKIAEYQTQIIIEIERITSKETEEKTLIQEGYFTGIWFRDSSRINMTIEN